MITKLIIPVIDTESGKYEYNGQLSQDEYFEMIQNKVNRTNNIMNEFANNYINSGNFISGGYSNMYDNENVKDEDIKYVYSESEALLEDINSDDINEEFLCKHINDEKKFILTVNINPSSLEFEAESEIRYWMDDSDMVLNDETLDQKTKIISLPQRNFIIDMSTEENIDGNIYQLLGCKILQIYSQEETKCPFYFAMMVEKIIAQ